MKQHEIWGIPSKELRELIGRVELLSGLSILFASVILIESGVGSCAGVPAILLGLKLVASGGKDLFDAKFSRKYNP